jgi:hypothetical protein
VRAPKRCASLRRKEEVVPMPTRRLRRSIWDNIGLILRIRKFAAIQLNDLDESARLIAPTFSHIHKKLHPILFNNNK